MRGTAGKWVGASSDSSSAIRVASPPQKQMPAPARITTAWATRAITCASGRNWYRTWLSSIPSSSTYIRAVASMLAWVSMHPLGGPVVPEV